MLVVPVEDLVAVAIQHARSQTMVAFYAKLEATLLTYASRDVEGSVQVPVYLTVTQNLVTGFPDTPLLNFAPAIQPAARMVPCTRPT